LILRQKPEGGQCTYTWKVRLQLVVCEDAARARARLDDFGELLELDVSVGDEVISVPPMFSGAIGTFYDGVVQCLNEVGDCEGDKKNLVLGICKTFHLQ
jgi:hypothetical protein